MALEERFPLSKNEKVSDLFCDIYLAKSIFFQFYLLSFIYYFLVGVHFAYNWN